MTQQLLRNMDQQDRERLSRVLDWPEDSAGGLMNTDTVSVRADVSLEVVQRYLRMRGELPDRTDRLFVVDRARPLPGHRSRWRACSPTIRKRWWARALDPEAPRIAPDTAGARSGAALPRPRPGVRRRWSDETGRLLGRITIDDVVDVIAEEAAHEVMAGAGLRDEEDVFASIVPATRRRIAVAGHQPVHGLPGAAWWCSASRAPSRRWPRWPR